MSQNHNIPSFDTTMQFSTKSAFVRQARVRLDLADFPYNPSTNSNKSHHKSDLIKDRSQILLPQIDAEIVSTAKIISQAMYQDWRNSCVLYNKLKGKWSKNLMREALQNNKVNDKKLELLQRVVAAKNNQENLIPLNIHYVNYQNFKNDFIEHCVKANVSPSAELLCLVALFSAQVKTRSGCFLKTLPHHMFDEDKEENINFKQILLRYVLGHKLGIKTAQDIENYKVLCGDIAKQGLASIIKNMSVIEILECAYPNCTTADDPIVRPWKIQQGTKWIGATGLNLATRASAWLLEYGVKVYDRGTGKLDIDKIKNTHWYDAVCKHGMRKIIELTPLVKNYLELIDLGAKALGVFDLIGLKESQLKPWEIKRLGMWLEKGKNGELLIDQVTKYLIEIKLRRSNPELFANSGQGELLPEKVLRFKRWSEEYNAIATDCLRSSKVKIPEALSRVYPELFGWVSNQISTWEMKYTGKWKGKKGVSLFRQAFAKALYRQGLGNYEASTGIYSFNRQQFEDWYSKYCASGKNLYVLLKEERLSSAIKHSKARGRLTSAVKILFNDELCLNLPTNQQSSIIEEFRKQLIKNNGWLSINVTKPTKETLLEKKLQLLNYKEEVKQALMALTELHPTKDRQIIKNYIQKIIEQDPLYIASLYGDSNQPATEFRVQVYKIRVDHKFKSVYNPADNKNFTSLTKR